MASGISQPVDLIVTTEGSLYYLARGGGAGGLLSRITYTLAAPRVNFTANGSDGLVQLSSADSLRLDLSFIAGSGGPLSSAEIYIGLSTPSGFLWLDPTQGFRTALSRVYVGSLGTFSASPWLTVPAGTLGSGGYRWIVLVDDDTDGIPTGDYSDFVVTVVE